MGFLAAQLVDDRLDREPVPAVLAGVLEDAPRPTSDLAQLRRLRNRPVRVLEAAKRLHVLAFSLCLGGWMPHAP